jgi:hypothetical protein
MREGGRGGGKEGWEWCTKMVNLYVEVETYCKRIENENQKHESRHTRGKAKAHYREKKTILSLFVQSFTASFPSFFIHE